MAGHTTPPDPAPTGPAPFDLPTLATLAWTLATARDDRPHSAAPGGLDGAAPDADRPHPRDPHPARPDARHPRAPRPAPPTDAPPTGHPPAGPWSDEAPPADQPPAGRRLLGIAGAPGAGKSTLARALVAAVRRRYGPDAAAYLPLDGFHLSHAQLRRLGLTDRKGSEPSFDVWGYAALLERVARERRHDVYVPDYDRTLHEPVAARHLVPPTARLVVTEGNYLACDAPGWRAARATLAEVWYLETADAVREERLLERQLAGGRDADRARAWVAGNDRPNGEQVKESRRRCDRVLVSIGMDMFNWRD
ncbi:hypothetical protein [Streptomyces sp. NPDC057702]|uniref:hypothetical protein n=1 Tax=unclassified Streptomyces TaxID=2593676 RepID=UPI0036B50362